MKNNKFQFKTNGNTSGEDSKTNKSEQRVVPQFFLFDEEKMDYKHPPSEDDPENVEWKNNLLR